jgi:hypothetical protein
VCKGAIRYACVIWLFFLIMHLYLIGMCLHEDQRRTSSTHMRVRDWTSSSGLINYSTFNSEHIWKDLCILTFTESINMHFHDNHNLNKGRSDFKSNLC